MIPSVSTWRSGPDICSIICGFFTLLKVGLVKIIIGSHLPRIFAYDNEMLVRFVPILGTTHSFLIDFTSHLTITPSPPPLKMWVESRENSRASIGRECQCPSEYWFSPFQILTLPDSSPLAKNLSLVCGHLRHVIGRFFWFPASFRDHKEDPFVPVRK